MQLAQYVLANYWLVGSQANQCSPNLSNLKGLSKVLGASTVIQNQLCFNTISIISVTGIAQASQCFYKNKTTYNLLMYLILTMVDVILNRVRYFRTKIIYKYFRGLKLRQKYLTSKNYQYSYLLIKKIFKGDILNFSK